MKRKGRCVLLIVHVFLGSCLRVYGDPKPQLGVADDLNTNSKLCWATSRCPILADSPAGVIYCIWPGKVQEHPSKDAGVPLIDGSLTYEAKDREWAEVPGISVFQKGQWSKPQILVEGVHECTPIFAWCKGESLQLLVASERGGTCRHICLDQAAEKWKQVADLPLVPSQYDAFRLQNEALHVAVAENGVQYLVGDKNKWSKPLAVAKGDVLRVRMAVDPHGKAFLGWKDLNSDQLSLASVSDGKVVTTLSVFKDDLVEGEEFDLAVDSKERLVIAYQPKSKNEKGQDNIVRIRSYSEGEWSKPTTIANAGKVFGSIKTLYSADGQILVSWIHSFETKELFGGSFSGQVRSFVTSSVDGWTDPKLAARYSGAKRLPQFAGDSFTRFHLGRDGIARMTWGPPAVWQCAVTTLGGKNSSTQAEP